MSDSVVQYVVGPTFILILAGLGWMIRSYLRAIRGQVEGTPVGSSHTPHEPLRDDVSTILAAVREHHDADSQLATEMAGLKVAVQAQGSQLNRIEGRLNAHIDQHNSDHRSVRR